MAARKTAAEAATKITTLKGEITVDEAATYRVSLAAPVRALGRWYRPSDRNVKFRGDVLLAVAAEAKGAIADAEAL